MLTSFVGVYRDVLSGSTQTPLYSMLTCARVRVLIAKKRYSFGKLSETRTEFKRALCLLVKCGVLSYGIEMNDEYVDAFNTSGSYVIIILIKQSMDIEILMPSLCGNL